VNDAERRAWPDGFDDDAIFADIIAHLNDESAEPEQAGRPSADGAAPAVESARSGAEDVEPGAGAADQATPQTGSENGSTPASDNPAGDLGAQDTPRADPAHWSINPPPGQPGEIDPPAEPAAQVWRAHEAADEIEEHFEPPQVSPLPAGDLQFWAIIAGMTFGPLLLLYLVLFNRDAGSYWILIAIGMSVGGFAMLVSRMPGPRDEDDDGARL